MLLAVEKGDLDVRDGETSQGPGSASIQDSLLDGRYVLSRNDATLYFGLKNDLLIGMLVLEGLDPQGNDGKLPPSSSLSDKTGLQLGGVGDSLSICD